MTDQTKYTAVKCDFIAPQTKMLQCTARQDMTIQGQNGASVTLKQGEKFTLVRSDSLGDGWFYVVRQVSGEKKCSCPSHKPCKHEKAVKTIKLTVAKPVESSTVAPIKSTDIALDIERFKKEWAKPVRQKEDWTVAAPLNGNRGFSLL